MITRAFTTRLFAAVGFFLLFGLFGCMGGGSTGTGLGASVDAAGVLTFEDGSPASGFTVRASTTTSNDEAVSDDEGRYDLDLDLLPGATILFVFDAADIGLHWEREIVDIPAGTRSLTVSWRVTADKRITPIAAEYFDENGNPLIP